MAKKKKKRRSTLPKKTTVTQKPEARPTRRGRIAQTRKQKRQRRRLIGILGVVVVIGGIVAVIWIDNRPLPLTTVEANVPVGADGAAWGPVAAPVVIEEWSDFQ
jgi:cytoskeletal protein RodZ